MKSSSIIRSFVSLLLIGLFAFSITPKKTLHTLVANHQDQSLDIASHYGTMVGVAGYHCDTENLVTSTPFNLSIQPFLLSAPSIMSIDKEVMIASFYSHHHFYSELRGPPVT